MGESMGGIETLEELPDGVLGPFPVISVAFSESFVPDVTETVEMIAEYVSEPGR
jgi:hypothetical protein